MRIGEAAKASGLSVDAIRFYERSGVLPPPPRQANRYRRYTSEHLETLRLAAGLRALGVPLDAVRAIVRVVHDGTCSDVRDALIDALSRAVSDVDDHIGRLTQLREQLLPVLAGLRNMRPDQDVVPGLAACPCVPMVSGSTAPRQASAP
jgi:DNA-binding transcriptional MerR regulator